VGAGSTVRWVFQSSGRGRVGQPGAGVAGRIPLWNGCLRMAALPRTSPLTVLNCDDSPVLVTFTYARPWHSAAGCTLSSVEEETPVTPPGYGRAVAADSAVDRYLRSASRLRRRESILSSRPDMRAQQLENLRARLQFGRAAGDARQQQPNLLGG
jgi:hypothetical protein